MLPDYLPNAIELRRVWILEYFTFFYYFLGRKIMEKQYMANSCGLTVILPVSCCRI